MYIICSANICYACTCNPRGIIYTCNTDISCHERLSQQNRTPSSGQSHADPHTAAEAAVRIKSAGRRCRCPAEPRPSVINGVIKAALSAPDRTVQSNWASRELTMDPTAKDMRTLYHQYLGELVDVCSCGIWPRRVTPWTMHGSTML
jgi:hypothetical protein